MSGWGSMVERVEAYLKARRAMGYQLRIEGEQLQRFARFADQQDHRGPLTLDLAVVWASQSHTASGIGRARRLEVIRPMARYCALYEPETQIPPPNLLGPGHRRVAPHIYSEREVSDMLHAARDLGPEGGLRPATMRCLIGLLASTGLRISEALDLSRDDVDLEHSLLRVCQTKFCKSRYVPVHRRHGMHWLTMLVSVIDGYPWRGIPPSCCSIMAMRLTGLKHATLFLSSALVWVGTSQCMDDAPACTICVTHLPAGGCRPGTRKVGM